MKRRRDGKIRDEEISSGEDSEGGGMSSDSEEEADPEAAVTVEERRLMDAQKLLEMERQYFEEEDGGKAARAQAKKSSFKRFIGGGRSFGERDPRPAHKMCVTTLEVDWKSNRCYTGGKDCNLIFWDLERLEKTRTIQGSRQRITEDAHFEALRSLCFLQHKQLLIAGGDDELIRAWDVRLAGEKPVRFFRGHTGPVSAVRQNAGRREDILFSSSEDRSLLEWDIRQQAPIGQHYGHTSAILRLEVAGTDRPVTAGEDGSMRVWKVDEDKAQIFDHHRVPVDALAVSSESAIFTGDQDSNIVWWSTRLKKPRCIVADAHATWLTSMVAVKQSNLLISGGYDGMVVLWEAKEEGKESSLIRREAIDVKGVVNEMKVDDAGERLVLVAGKDHIKGRWLDTTGFQNRLMVVPLDAPPRDE